MPYPEFSAVRLTSVKFADEGVGQGALGIVLEAEDTGYLVEFSRPNGTTIALLYLEPGDVELAPEFMVTTPIRTPTLR